MRLRLHAVSLVATLGLGAASCGSSARNNWGAANDFAGQVLDLSFTTSTDQAQGACAQVSYEGKEAPAAILVLLDRSSSMADNNKFNFAAQAIVQVYDQDLFDTMSIGLMSAPSSMKNGPMCIFGIPVACGSPAFPQVDLAVAGKTKSNGGAGVRRDIKGWLAMNSPDQGAGDATPLYDAIQSAISDLQGWPMAGKRILFVISDGTIDCTQYSNRPGFPDCNGCDHEWESPSNIVAMLQKANQDPQKPVETFVMGVPGADSFDQTGCNAPPYHMRAALSAMAWAGSPSFAPPNCTGKTFAQNTADPKVPCHFDLSQGNFNANAISTALSQVRGKLLGCAFDLPNPDGGTLDPSQVNVDYVVAGKRTDLKKRLSPNNACLATGCWDYDKNGKVQLIGKACSDVQGAADAKVEIVVGCPTEIG